MFDRFTDRARKAMQFANQEAQRVNHPYIGAEHILLGIAKEGGGVAASVLRSLDIDLRKIRLEIERRIQPGTEIIDGKLPFTPQAKLAIEKANAEGTTHVGTEHLLLGLIQADSGFVNAILAEVSGEALTVEQWRAKITETISEAAAVPLDVLFPGAQVRLRSGGPAMTLVDIGAFSGRLFCQWVVNGAVQESSFQPYLLERA